MTTVWSDAPLTRSQELIWAGQSLAGDAPVYNQAWRFDIEEPLVVGDFTAALNQIVSSFEPLRTAIVETPTGPRRRIFAPGPAANELVDLTFASEVDVDSWIDQRTRRSFDLSRGAYDSALIQRGPRRWIWFFNQHHIVTDAAAAILIFEAMSEMLSASKAGAPPPGFSPPSFEAHARLEVSQRQSTAGLAAATYWEKRASAAPMRAPIYGRAPKNRAADAKREIITLGAERMQKLNALASTDGFRSLSRDATRFNIIATTLFAFLTRVSDQRSHAIGVPAHNRVSLLDRQTPGLFIELFPMMMALEENETFRSLHQKVRHEAFDLLRNARQGASSVVTARAFSVVLNYIAARFNPSEGAAHRLGWAASHAIDSNHDLRLHVWDFNGDDALTLAFDLNTSALPDFAQHNVGAHFMALFDAMLDNPDKPVDTVRIATSDEQQWMLTDYNLPAASEESRGTILSMFAECVASYPQKAALREGESTISFQALDDWSNTIASKLTQMGMEPGAIIGIHMRRSSGYVAAVLGVLKAGCAFAPLEADMPAQRMTALLKAATPALVIADEDLARGMPIAPTPIVMAKDLACVDHAFDPGRRGPISASDVAYVIHTSGSTGVPKGVLVDHSGLVQYITWAANSFGGEGAISMPLFSALGFDLTMTSLFVPLTTGGTVVIYPEELSLGPDLSVLNVFSDDAVDVVKLTPAHLSLVTESCAPTQRIRSIILGGEDLKTSLAARARQKLGDHVAIYNEYGPTEAVVGCMIHQYDPSQDLGSSVPIGAPAEGSRIYLLDAGFNPCPIGAPGEIFIGGDRLAAGYLNNPEATTERFIRDPFASDPGAKMYRTGDLACFDTQGRLVYLGRADRQVKIRGVRIELGEIEQAIAAAAPVKDVVVAAISATAQGAGEERYCTGCGLPASHPEASMGVDGVCSICLGFERYKNRAKTYFRDIPDLQRLLSRARAQASGDYDCLMLTSGGKDSVYALYQLAALGPRILAVTLDNGYLSEGAKANISRCCAQLGVDHRYVSTAAMNAIFVDSLRRHANVCQGCFKTIYTLALRIANEVGAPAIVTGLSRGQFFETRLTSELFNGESEPDIDTMTLAARRAYHMVDDAVSRHLDTRFITEGGALDQVEFIDFYRYSDVPVEEIYRFLTEETPWSRPDDTGRSSNCLINDVGIYIHKRVKGYHNYALPYSWDVRMGHKKRDAALDELNDDIDETRVLRILDEIGYDTLEQFPEGDQVLTAYYVADTPVSPAALRDTLRRRLPQSMTPARFIQVDRIPLTPNGKTDFGVLAGLKGDMLKDTARNISPYRAPQTEMENLLTEIWEDMLDVERVGVDDNFYDLGGDSIAAIRIASLAASKNIVFSATAIFEHQTITELAACLEQNIGMTVEGIEEEGVDAFGMVDLDPDTLQAIAAAMTADSNPRQ
ncbi:MAG: amino acid adenylation domain-containing protein [Rhodobacteraceae bacterium]|nr:amino acid adenylation domain-containing protein [Paracoccaceae bacterium]